MIEETDSPLKEFGKEYFRGLLKDKNVTGNLRMGNELRVGIQFYGEDGKVIKTVMETIKKDEL
jgi:metal-dependent HD superfamily phosphatase/phosphodiesterase